MVGRHVGVVIGDIIHVAKIERLESFVDVLFELCKVRSAFCGDCYRDFIHDFIQGFEALKCSEWKLNLQWGLYWSLLAPISMARW
jgi:hypothetical protein